jgi:phospholipase C
MRGSRLSRAWSIRAMAVGVVIVAGLAACTSSGSDPHHGRRSHPLRSDGTPAGIHKIKHVIIIMQENRSFDSYFGTYPGADGLRINKGVATACVPNPAGGCDRPYHDTADVNGGGPHGFGNAVADVDHGKMDGFLRQRKAVTDPACITGTPDVMGYHTAAEIPNYWKYAQDFALDDHMFEPVKSWSLPDHLYMVSAWSARCKNRSPMSCVNDIVGPYGI